MIGAAQTAEGHANEYWNDETADTVTDKALYWPTFPKGNDSPMNLRIRKIMSFHTIMDYIRACPL